MRLFVKQITPFNNTVPLNTSMIAFVLMETTLALLLIVEGETRLIVLAKQKKVNNTRCQFPLSIQARGIFPLSIQARGIVGIKISGTNIILRPPDIDSEWVGTDIGEDMRVEHYL